MILKSLRDNVYLKTFHEKGESYLTFLCESRVARMAFLSAYKELEPISREERKGLKVYVTAMFPDKSARFRVEAIRIIYTVGNLL